MSSFKSVAVLATFAASAMAAPSIVEAHADIMARGVNACDQSQKNTKVVCCDAAQNLLGCIANNVGVLGVAQCKGTSAFCCNSNVVGGLINVGVLNCPQIL